MPPAAKNGMADAMPFFEAVKKDSFLTKGGLPDCSARAVRLRRTARTFAGREVFSSPHMSPKKMIPLLCRSICSGLSTAAPLGVAVLNHVPAV